MAFLINLMVNVITKEQALNTLDGLHELIACIENPDDYTVIREGLTAVIRDVDVCDDQVFEAIHNVYIRIRGEVTLREILDPLVGGFEDESDDSESFDDVRKEFCGTPVVRNVDFMIMEPGKLSSPMVGDRGIESGANSLIPRTAMIFDILSNCGVDLDDCEHIFGIHPEDYDREIWRNQPYTGIVIPEMDRLFLVCDEMENATYVIFTSENPDHYLKMKKEELRELFKNGDASLIKWRKNVDGWKNSVLDLLFEKPEPEEGDVLKNYVDAVVNGEEVELEVVDGSVLLPTRLFGNRVSLILNGQEHDLIGFNSYCENYGVKRTRPARLFRICNEASVFPIDGVKFFSRSGKLFDAYEYEDLKVLKVVTINPQGVGVYDDLEGNTKEAIQLGKYSRHLKMGYATLENIIIEAGIEKITGINFEYSKEMYPKDLVDKALEAVPFVDGETGIVCRGDETIELVALRAYFRTLGLSITDQTFHNRVTSIMNPYSDEKVLIKYDGKYGRAVDVYLKSEVDKIVLDFFQDKYVS